MGVFTTFWLPWLHRTSKLFTLMIITFLWLAKERNCSEVANYIVDRYANPNMGSKFNHFAVDNRTGNVYIGAENGLLSLTNNLRQTKNIQIIPACSDAECTNYNKVLLIDYFNEKLITCGSENDGSCQRRSLNDIADIAMVTLVEDNKVVASVRNTTTEAIIVKQTLYVAATFDAERYLTGEKQIPPICARTLRDNDPFTIETNRKTLFGQGSVSTSPFIISYVKSFLSKDFVYFVTHQRQDFNGDVYDRNYVSKMNRVCVEDDTFRTYTEIWIQCQGKDGPETVYNLVQTAHVGVAGPELAASFNISTEDQLLYAVFSKNTGDGGNVASNNSAMCIFKMEDVERKFIDAIHGCLSDGNDYNLGYLHGSSCPGFGNTVGRNSAVGQQCSAINYQYADSKFPLVSTAIIEWQDVVPASVITVTHRAHTVAFVGTAQGTILKVHIENSTTGREYERVNIGSPVLRDTMVEADQQRVMVLTENQLLRLNVEDCGQYTSCVSCIGEHGGTDGDPYCGWCSLQNRCTRYEVCPQSQVESRWLPYNSSQCVSISDIAPFDSLPVTSSHQQLQLTVAHLPDLATGHYYKCFFDNWESEASKDGSVLSCISPPASVRPLVSTGDHVTAQLYVYSSETQVKFVNREFYFYECSKHKSCEPCANSRWACNWCIHGNRCTHENGSVCGSDDRVVTGRNNPKKSDRHGPGFCPQLDKQMGEILVSVGIKMEIVLTASNLPDDDKVTSYQCALEIEGKLQTTPAHKASHSNSTIICESKVYSYTSALQVQELNASLSVKWNGNRLLDDLHRFNVTLYNCAIGRPDCSRCISKDTTRQELLCGWCKDSHTCGVQGSPGCTRGVWIPADSLLGCPAPGIFEISPTSGPHEGDTVINITGRDLGQQFSDIIAVTIGSRNCSLEGFDYLYRTGNSVSCRVAGGSPNKAESVRVKVWSADEKTIETSIGDAVFNYRDPVITNFFPKLGPKAGGTAIKIEGRYLDIGGNRIASIGDVPCVMESESASIVHCATSPSRVTGYFNLSMTFDTHIRLALHNFTYADNPVISDVRPKKSIQSGGRLFHVIGTNLNTVQEPMILLQFGEIELTKLCTVLSSTSMTCPSPPLQLEPTRRYVGPTRRRRQSESGPSDVTIGFIMDGVKPLQGWSKQANVTFTYHPDPMYYPFEDERHEYQPILQIFGENLNVASDEADVQISIGNDTCVIATFGAKVLTCSPPMKLSGSNNVAIVMVRHANLRFKLGEIVYPEDGLDSLLIYILAGIGGFLLVFILLMIVVYRRKSVVVRREQRLIMQEISKQEEKIREQARKAFAELQLSVDALASDLEGKGMPFLTEREYATRVLFKGLHTLPDTADQHIYEEECCYEAAMLEFGSLLLDKDFMRIFTQTLEEQNGIGGRDKGTIASLLMVYMILVDKLQYLTDDVLIPLMSVNIAEAVQKNRPKQLFRRADSIVGKLLSSWVALCLYDFLKSHAAYPLYLLYSAIKVRCFTGPVDHVHGAAHYSLSESYTLREEIDYKELTLKAIQNDNDNDIISVSVLDVDTISQVKKKILDGMFRNKPYSYRPAPDDVDLEWRRVTREPMVLKDIDETTLVDGHWKKINTLHHYQIPDGAYVAIVDKLDDSTLDTPGETDVDPLVKAPHKLSLGSLTVDTSTLKAAFRQHSKFEEIELDENNYQWHLTKDNYNHGQRGTLQMRTFSMIRGGRSDNVITDFHFSRQLSTKTTVQNYIDGMLKTVLTASNRFPAVIKRLFDFFDQQINLHDIEDPDVIHIWKSNSLLLRFWLNSITHPDYLFDIYEAPVVEASLGVVAQALLDACSTTEHKLAKDAPFNKLLFARDVPTYKKMVDKYYHDIQLLPASNQDQLALEYKKICHNFSGMFSKLSTLKLLHEYAYRYHDQLMSALEEDEVCNQHSLADRLQKVTSDIYPNEC